MSAADEDTELRDLLVQNLENSGVLNKMKAEMRAAVFLAMEDQDRLESKTPLVNEDLKKCLNSRDGRLVASLIVDFLQVFNLDFTLAVFQPEINSLNGLDNRDLVCRELGLAESEQNRKSPLLLELIGTGRPGGQPAQELSQRQITEAHSTFDFYDKDQSGYVGKEDLKNIFTDLLPNMNKNMLERFVCDELNAADRSSSDTVRFPFFLGMYRRLFSQCRSVVVQDSGVNQQQCPEDKPASAPVSKDSDHGLSRGKEDLHPPSSSSAVRPARLELEIDPDEGDSFFDDPLPKPQKTYGCQNSLTGPKDPSDNTDGVKDVILLSEECLSGPVISPMRRGKSLNDLSVLADDLEGVHPPADRRKLETSGIRGSPVASLSEASKPGRGGESTTDHSHSRIGAVNSRDKGLKNQSDRTGSLHLDEEVEYDDDFNSHRSDLSKSELSIGEEIEEVSIEGPDDSEKLDEITQDLSVSQLSQRHGVDYMEDVG
ncbi:FGFR1 oncogene partner isoform X2 [Cololabis saira]|uniref:FGFR1 oncogene partner isoform X2 n=1 Tax=Cololabis saira TaxID=129043 RepID=UPI002AD39D67|nr:FGFR1 oncogene partner isoform X2 [Cololabis saira]